ncbi:MAG: type II secretion system protein [Kiritimatiellia bacterium]
MKRERGFTLIEIMVVVTILVILMSIVFRLSNLGADNERRTRTVVRLQRLENCLSGYHAAFGSYPPVKLHGTRDIYRRVGTHGLQSDERNESIWNWSKIGEQNEYNAWSQVKAACRSQPIDCRYPFPSGYSRLVDVTSGEMKRRAESGEDQYAAYFEDESRRRRLTAGFDDGTSRNVNRHAKHKGDTDWNSIQLFKFGLMSFLLPRYLVMMNGDDVFFTDYAQWTGNNTMPSDPFTGKSYEELGGYDELRRNATSLNRSEFAKVANIPSQAVCARWMPNLERMCHCNHGYSLFGIDLKSDTWGEGSELNVDNYDIEIFSPADADSDSTANQYVLDGITVRDGWLNEIYYYSPAPYQTYRIWSSGPNGRTFPPWISRKDLGTKAQECVALWTVDDIENLRH